MTKEQKVNYIKYWLQAFGIRDNETFNTEVEVGDKTWGIWLQYSFDEGGDQIEPYDNCSSSNKLICKSINMNLEEDLDAIISALKQKKTHW